MPIHIKLINLFPDLFVDLESNKHLRSWAGSLQPESGKAAPCVLVMDEPHITKNKNA
jgi:hypothetical protein